MAQSPVRRSRRLQNKARMSSIKVNGRDNSHDMELGLHYTVDQDEAKDQKLGEASMSLWGIDGHDKISMITLFVLYCLQGIPMGLSASIPLLLKEQGSSYEGLSLFSLVSLPFSCKLLWAPVVDSVYMKSVGRRKSWLIPVQMVTGLVMILSSSYIEGWLYGRGSEGPHVEYLTAFFLSLYFLMATQDIAVDGWALTMLSKENVGYASTCNTIGQLFGYFLSNQGFVALSDGLWCQRFLGMDGTRGLVTLHSFVAVFGWVFLVVTLLVWAFKEEREQPGAAEPDGLVATYKQVIGLSKLSSVRSLCLVLMTVKVAFAPADSVATFKLQEYGMPKADIATYSPIPLVIGLFLPAFISSTVAADPISVVRLGIPLKLFTCFLSFLVVQATPAAYAYAAQGIGPSTSFLCGFVGTMILHEISGTLIFMSFMSFFNKVADPAIGGTYMTLLNTISNLGYKWPNSLALFVLPKITTPELDGYTIETMAGFIIGIAWLFSMSGLLRRLQNTRTSAWAYSGAGGGKDV
jgi:PAT family acetyl-CoA transporter-like MFS transporter 1